MRSLALVLIAASALFPQTSARRVVRAYGEGIVSVKPDQAKVTFSVITQGDSASAAADANVTRATSVIAALQQQLGNSGEVRTINYSLSPIYMGNPTRIVGYSATNTVQAVVNNTALLGRVIDAGIGAGASRTDGIQLSLRDESSARAQALRAAGLIARSKADSIAQGLGLRLGSILSAVEGVSTSPITVDAGPAATANVTPIVAGNLEVRATITLDVEIAP